MNSKAIEFLSGGISKSQVSGPRVHGGDYREDILEEDVHSLFIGNLRPNNTTLFDAYVNKIRPHICGSHFAFLDY